ncbi:unnamed protein product, partial [marine sediment metagenome]
FCFWLIKFAMGAATDKEAGILMEEGAVYAVTYKGKVKITGGRTVNKFLIEEVNLTEIPEGEPGGDIPS